MPYISHSWINQNTIESRDYQESIMKSALQKNTLCVIPTGLGKTSIAVMVSAERLKQDFEKVNFIQKKTDLPSANPPHNSQTRIPNLLDFSQKKEYAKVLLVAPTKPLVNQHRSFFERAMKIGSDELVAVTGEMKPKERKQVYEKADIIFATPQTVHNDMKHGILNLRLFCLLIVDEAHRSVGNYSYVYIAKKYMEQSRSPLILALTASPGSQRTKLREICSALSIENIEIRNREDLDVRPYVQEMRQTWIEIDMPAKFLEIKQHLEKCRESRIRKLQAWNINIGDKTTKRQLLALQQSLARRKSGYSFAVMSVVAEIIKLDYVILLLETQSLYSLTNYISRLADDSSKAAARLLKDENFIAAAKQIEELHKAGIENPKLAKLGEITVKEISAGNRMIVFAQYRDTVDKICETLKQIPDAKPAIFIGQAKKSRKEADFPKGNSIAASLNDLPKRIVTSGLGMSQKEQMGIISRFKSGEFNIIISTSIGEEGLDIEETDTVIFYEPVPSEIRSIQRAGRTARTRPGKVIILMVKNSVDQAYYWSAHHKKQKMKNVLESMKSNMKSVYTQTTK